MKTRTHFLLFISFLLLSMYNVILRYQDQSRYQDQIIIDGKPINIDISDCIESVPMYNEIVCIICTRKGDGIVSESIEMYGAWELYTVNKVMKAMDHYKDAVFIDAGSNIGAFTIPVASMKRKVIAVDLMTDNLAFIKKSLSFTNLTQYAHLVNNAISDKHEVLHPAISNNNRENQRTNFGAIQAIKLEDKNNNINVVGASVQSVTLADLTKMEHTSTFILKLDLENLDCQALSVSGLFENNFIPYIFIEWNNHLESCLSMKTKLYRHGYTPWSKSGDSILKS